MKKAQARAPGFDKLQKFCGFCEKASDYGTEFPWSDTCRITNASMLNSTSQIT
ncbi:hypothetical protein BDR05DRAFT_1023157 [Suillus weaverae]|nr:hypothetical protein BDR05DRAFT_1023157 [Suillus weaverae]